MALAPSTPDLAGLRARIDAIDDQIADLLVARLAIVRQVGQIKGDRAAGRLALRLGREAQMLRRLLERTAGGFPAVGTLRIWREIIAISTQIEVPFGCLVDGTGGVLLHDLARDQVGSATPIETVADAFAALERLRSGGPWLAVLAPPEPSAWWPAALPDAVRVVGRLPLTGTGRPRGWVAARLEPEPSGADRTLLLADHLLPGAMLLASVPGSQLVEIDGFPDPSALPPGCRLLGAYPAPLPLPNLPDEPS
mgnify:CR=1 FL=1